MNTQVRKIYTEIERLKESMKGLEPHSDFRRGQITAYRELLSFIDTLPESNRPKLSDSLEEAAGVKETPINLDDEIVEYWKIMEWSKSIPLSKFKVIARYFYGLGLAARLKITMAEDKEVKSAAVTTADRLLANPKDYALSAKADYWNGSYEGFIAGAQWQKDRINIDISKQVAAAYQLGEKGKEEQMLKDAVEGYVNYYEDSGGILMAEAQVGCPYHNGDKVKIIIVKEGEK